MWFFKVKHSTGHISGMVGLIDVKWKGGEPVWYWVNYVTLTFDLSHDLDLGLFKVKCQNSFISGIVICLMWNEKKANQLDTGLTVYGLALAVEILQSCTTPSPWNNLQKHFPKWFKFLLKSVVLFVTSGSQPCVVTTTSEAGSSTLSQIWLDITQAIRIFSSVNDYNTQFRHQR